MDLLIYIENVLFTVLRRNRQMKTKYKVLLAIIFAEWGLGTILTILGINTLNLSGNSLWLAICVAPLEILWFWVWRDKDLKLWIRIISCVLFWHFLICYVTILTVSLFHSLTY